MPARHLKLGKKGEDMAVEHLKSKGYKVIDRNWRAKQLELDIVCTKDDGVIFVEVKTRGRGSLATPADGLSRSKRASLVMAATKYLSKRGWWEKPCRFDLIAIKETDSGLELNHVEGAFDHTQALGRGYDQWQPW